MLSSRQLLAAWSQTGNNRRPFPRQISSIFTGCKASGMAAFSRRARKRQECTFVWLQSLASSSGNNAFSIHQVTSAIVGPGTNRRFLPVAEIESAVRSSETSNLPCSVERSETEDVQCLHCRPKPALPHSGIARGVLRVATFELADTQYPGGAWGKAPLFSFSNSPR